MTHSCQDVQRPATAGRYPFLVPLFTVVLATAAIAGGVLATAWDGPHRTAWTTFLLFLAVLTVTRFLHVDFHSEKMSSA